MSMVCRVKHLRRALTMPASFLRLNASVVANPVPSEVLNNARLSGYHFMRTNFFMRHYASPPATEPEEPDFLKRMFFKLMKKYRMYVSELRKQKITLDPDDPKAVLGYKDFMNGIRKKVGLISPFQHLQKMIFREAESAPDLKTFYKALPKIKARFGIKDPYDGDRMMVEAVEKVEKELGRVLVRGDEEGCALLQKEFDRINKELGVDPSKMKEMKDECELQFAKSELLEIKHEVVETIEAHKKRRGLEEINIDIRKLDHRTFL